MIAIKRVKQLQRPLTDAENARVFKDLYEYLEVLEKRVLQLEQSVSNITKAVRK